MNEPIAILGDKYAGVRRFTQVCFVPHEFNGRHWMVVEVGVECCSKEFNYSIDQIRDLRDKLSAWLGDSDELRPLRQTHGRCLFRGDLRPDVR